MTNEIDLDWDDFCNDTNNITELNEKQINNNISSNNISNNNILNNKISNNKEFINNETPKCSDIYISTKTIISYLNYKNINLYDIFWKLNIQPYYLPCEGAIKKQMKFNSNNIEDLKKIQENLLLEKNYIDEYIINQIINPDGRIKFKDIRKISIGLSKKDITSYRCKKKSAFYNCFVVILRLFHNESYKEVHVKIFNTGKLEIPGIQNNEILDKVLKLIKTILIPIINIDYPLNLLKDSEIVLINSNFNCGYYINREQLYKSLKYKYNINSVYDPCSYPGIQCEFYHNSKLNIQTGKKTLIDTENDDNITKVSFMIFRTGSVLIVGKCSEKILYEIYSFLKNMLQDEYKINGGKILNSSDTSNKINLKISKRIRKKIIILDK